MKIYIYQRFDINDQLFECISKNKKEVHEFIVKDLDSIGISSEIDENDPDNNLDFNDWDPKDIIHMCNEGGMSCYTQRQMLFIRFDEIEV